MKNMNKLSLTPSRIMTILRRNEKQLKTYSVKRLGLFGSYVRGDQKSDSDLDFLVELRKPAFNNFMDLCFFLEDTFGQKVDLVTRSDLSPYLRPYVEDEVKWHEIG